MLTVLDSKCADIRNGIGKERTERGKEKSTKSESSETKSLRRGTKSLDWNLYGNKTYENHFKGTFHWPYSGIGMRRFSSKNHACENFAVIGIQRRLAVSFSNKMLFRNCPVFSCKEKSQRLLRLFSFQNRPLSCSRHVGFETRLNWHKQCTQNKLCILEMAWALFMPVQPRFKSGGWVYRINRTRPKNVW